MFVTKLPSQSYMKYMLMRLVQKIGKGIRGGMKENTSQRSLRHFAMADSSPRTVSKVTDQVVERMLKMNGLS